MSPLPPLSMTPLLPCKNHSFPTKNLKDLDLNVAAATFAANTALLVLAVLSIPANTLSSLSTAQKDQSRQTLEDKREQILQSLRQYLNSLLTESTQLENSEKLV